MRCSFGAVITKRRVAAVPVTPAFTGAIDTRQLPRVVRRIVQVATRELVDFCSATLHDPRTVCAACDCVRLIDCRVALMR